MEMINLTPHAVNVRVGEEMVEIKPSGVVARVSETQTAAGAIDFGGNTIPLISKRFGNIISLPELQVDTFFIVSALVAQAAWAEGRTDIVCPGDPIRDPEGRIVGCASFCARPE